MISGSGSGSGLGGNGLGGEEEEEVELDRGAARSLLDVDESVLSAAAGVESRKARRVALLRAVLDHGVPLAAEVGGGGKDTWEVLGFVARKLLEREENQSEDRRTKLLLHIFSLQALGFFC